MSGESDGLFRSGSIRGDWYLNPEAFPNNSEYLAALEKLTTESTERSKFFQRLTPEVEKLLYQLGEEVKNKIGEEAAEEL